MRRFLLKVRSMWLKCQCRKYVTITGRCMLHPGNAFEGANKLGDNSELYHCYMGYGSYIAAGTFLQYVKMGKYCSVGKNVQCAYGRHPSRKFVSTHPTFFSPKNTPLTYVQSQKFDDSRPILDENYSILIGNDVWIGDGVLLLEGITIGDGAIIAAGAVVTKDVAPYTIVGGVPSKMIRARFNDEETEFLNKFQWWNYSEEWLKEHVDDFSDIQKFMKINSASIRE